MKRKKCFKCNKLKPLSDFYKHPQMPDGTVNKCKECSKKDTRDHRLNPKYREKVLRYDKERFKKPERKKLVAEYQRKRRSKHPEKERARRLIGYRLRRGILKPLPCEICGNKKTEAHHDDYSKPLEIRWLCFKCHRRVHGQYKNSPF